MIGWWSMSSKGSEAIIAYEITFVILNVKEILFNDCGLAKHSSEIY